MTDEDLALLFREMRESASTPLVIWLKDHYQEMRDLTQGRRVSWAAVVQHLGSLGIKNKNGSPLRPECARGAWARVQSRMRNREDLAACK
jgi:hypothetical protein